MPTEGSEMSLFLFVIGPLLVAQGYEIRDAPEACQGSPQGDLLCGKCGKSLSLAFDSPPDSGEARCGCDDVGFRHFTRTQTQNKVPLSRPTKDESGDIAYEPPVRSSTP
jgi:hypothetical protein